MPKVNPVRHSHVFRPPGPFLVHRDPHSHESGWGTMATTHHSDSKYVFCQQGTFSKIQEHSSEPISLLLSPAQCHVYILGWLKRLFRFSVTSYGKTWRNFMYNPVKRGMEGWITVIPKRQGEAEDEERTTKEPPFFFFFFKKKDRLSISPLVVSNSLRPPQTVAHQAPLSMEFSRQEY